LCNKSQSVTIQTDTCRLRAVSLLLKNPCWTNGKATSAIFERRAVNPRAAHATRGSRLKYGTRFLAAPPAGFLEQKRDCSQSRIPGEPHFITLLSVPGAFLTVCYVSGTNGWYKNNHILKFSFFHFHNRKQRCFFLVNFTLLLLRVFLTI